MPLSKRSRGERDAPRTSEPTGKQHLYLIFDEDLGYSIRKLNLANAGGEQRCLPPPFIRLEARRGRPEFFAAVGTKILATHPRFEFCQGGMEPGGILPIVDVRSRGVIFGPGEVRQENPIYLPLGDKLFALDTTTFEMLSMKPMWPPRLEYDHRHQISLWSWVSLPMPAFHRMDVTSYAVGSDGQTILFSTDAATFSFDCQRREWKKLLEWPLPFSGQAYYVHDLDVFVGLPKDVDDDSGRLCFCRWSGDDKHVWLSKENLSSKDPAENHHVGTSSLVYLGGSKFCLVECLGNGSAKAVQEWLEKWQDKWQEKWGELGQTAEEGSTEEEGCPLGLGEEGCPDLGSCCLTTFSLSSDMNGDLMAAKTAVQCYKMPLEAAPNVNPVAFWL